jgi:predicted ribosomally synthesized peptide with SipW-like signal peptide
MIKRLTLAVLAIGLTSALGGLAGLAVFTDTESAGGNTFTTATVDISIAPTSAIVTFSGMAPGDSVTDDVVVTNAGSIQLRYAISGSATNPDAKVLKDQLALTIKTIDVTTPGTPCDNFDGTQLYTGDLDGTTGALVGSNAQGAQAGDRTLNTAASETLCFRVSLPGTTGNAYQNATTTATFTFDAEQTQSNP